MEGRNSLSSRSRRPSFPVPDCPTSLSGTTMPSRPTFSRVIYLVTTSSNARSDIRQLRWEWWWRRPMETLRVHLRIRTIVAVKSSKIHQNPPSFFSCYDADMQRPDYSFHTSQDALTLVTHLRH